MKQHRREPFLLGKVVLAQRSTNCSRCRRASLGKPKRPTQNMPIGSQDTSRKPVELQAKIGPALAISTFTEQRAPWGFCRVVSRGYCRLKMDRFGRKLQNGLNGLMQVVLESAGGIRSLEDAITVGKDHNSCDLSLLQSDPPGRQHCRELS